MPARRPLASTLLLCALGACSESPSDDVDASDVTPTDALPADASTTDADATPTDAASDVGASVDVETDDDVATVEAFRVVTFNAGSGASPGNAETNAGFGEDQKEVADEWYGNGLAWKAIVEDTRAAFAELDADIVAFQEIFWPGECPNIPAEHHTGFVCEDAPAGDGVSVVAQVLGDEWQVVCHPEKPDKCIAVHARFGRFEGCDAAECLDGMAGERVPDCGSGARVAAATIVRTSGERLRVVSFHGTSGFDADETACRVAQVEQVFGTESSDGLVTDDPNLVLGDLNTDPGRLSTTDPSAARWTDFVGDGLPFQFHTAVGNDAEPTYVLLNIDHVASDAFVGSCAHPGVTPGWPAVTDAVHFDHVPAVCDLTPR